jgi:hypothetical protein
MKEENTVFKKKEYYSLLCCFALTIQRNTDGFFPRLEQFGPIWLIFYLYQRY